DIDYTCGVFFVNEDWYGHQNSTVNYLIPDDPDGDYWHYRVIQSENPGKELGCTNQFGTIWNGRFYLIAKQDKDPGASVTGGRITVADARTMKILHQSSLIDPSGAQCDGRGFVGVTNDKGYVSSSNGVWVMDLNTFEIKGQIEGSANPNMGDDKPNTDPTGSLYHGQSGSMVLAAGRVFVAHQQSGLLVVDPATDKVTNILSLESVAENAGIGSVVLARDGSLWLSVAQGTNGSGATLPYLVRVDPVSLDTEVINVPEGMYPPANSWYAWTPDAFCASAVTNSLYRKGGQNRWFAGTKIFKFDIDTRSFNQIIDLDKEGANWKLYGCSMRLHPITDEIYMSLYHEFGPPPYVTRRYTANGEKIRDYDMISNYWFPSLPVFPQSVGATDFTEAVADKASGIRIVEQRLHLTGLKGTDLRVYTLQGSVVLVQSVPDDDCTLDLPLPPGFYIVRAAHHTLKIVI
ncbi:MAG: DUF5074 domain-containing protein, partial [Muribaculaceae bacterium]|nr:DUF5074 domain-containing protein [Muribaculaceae bacterium]